MRTLFFVATAVVCGLSWIPRTASADPPSEARDLFERGRALRGQGDCASALPLFRSAFDVYPEGLGSLRNLAECDESLGRFASARRAWLDLKRALLGREEPKYAGWALDAEQGAARVAPRVATLTIELAVTNQRGEAAPSQGIEVTANGERIDPALLGKPLDEDPGHYLVRASSNVLRDKREEAFDLAAGESKRVKLTFVLSTETTRQVATSQAGSVRRTAGWVATGVGALGLVGATVSLVVYQQALDDVAGANCPKSDAGYVCTGSQKEKLQPAVDRGKTASVLVNVFGAVGVAGLASGIVLLVPSLWPSSSNAALVLSPTGAHAVWKF